MTFQAQRISDKRFLLFLMALGAVIAREIVAGKNWRNLKVLTAVAVSDSFTCSSVTPN